MSPPDTPVTSMVENGIARLALNRPEKRNALDAATVSACRTCAHRTFRHSQGRIHLRPCDIMFAGVIPQSVADDPWLSVHDCAVRGKCHEATVRRLIAAGLLRHARVGAGRKIIRVRASWFDTCLEQCATPVEAQ